MDPVLNPLLLPLMNWSPGFTILLLSLLINFIVTIIYKYTTDQTKMKELKEETKKMQEEMKALRDKPDKMMKVQKKMMSKNMEYSKHSMKSMLFTLLPLLLIFGWMNTHLAFYSLEAGAEFDVILTLADTPLADNLPTLTEIEGIEVVDLQFAEKSVKFVLKGDAGTYEAPTLQFNYKGEILNIPLYIGKDRNEFRYTPNIVVNKDNTILEKAQIKYAPLKPFGNLSLFGWRPGWLGTYLISSIVFSMLIRKLMKVY